MVNMSLFGKQKNGNVHGGGASNFKDSMKELTDKQNEVSAKLTEMENRLKKVRADLSKATTLSQKESIKERGKHVLKLKRMLLKRQDFLDQNILKLEEMKIAEDSMKDNATVMKALQSAKSSIEAQAEDLGIDDLDDLSFDMDEMMEQQNHLEDIMGQGNYSTPDLDEDLLAELDVLDELDTEDLDEDGSDEIPEFLKDLEDAPSHAPAPDPQKSKSSIQGSNPRRLA